MIKKILGSALLLFSVMQVGAQINDYNYRFQINGTKEKDTIYLANYYGKGLYYFDTAYVSKAGTFAFKKKKELKPGIFAVVLPSKKMFEMVINEPTFAVKSDTSDLDKKATYEGSKENQLFSDYKAFMVSHNMEATPIRALMDSAKDPLEKEKYKKELIRIDEEVKAYQKKLYIEHGDTYTGKMIGMLVEIDVPDSPKDASGNLIDSNWTYYYYKNHYFDRIDVKNDYMANCPIFHNKVEYYIKNVILQHPDTIVAATVSMTKNMNPKGEMFKYTVNTVNEIYNKSDIMGMDAVFVGLADEFYLSGKAFWVDSARKEKIRVFAENIRPLLIGKQAIPLSLADTTHKNWKKLYDEKAEYTVLVFWEPSCGHCKKDMPILAELYNKTQGKSFNVYAVSGDSNDDWRKFIKDNKMGFTNVAVPLEIKKDQNELYRLVSKGFTDEKSLNYADTYDVYSTPRLYVLDKDKKIVGKQVPFDQLEGFLQRLRDLEKLKKS